MRTYSPSELIAFENEIEELFAEGRIKAPIHLSGGNEEELIRIFKDIMETVSFQYNSNIRPVVGDLIMSGGLDCEAYQVKSIFIPTDKNDEEENVPFIDVVVSVISLNYC